MSAPELTVLVPSFNQARYLPATIDSIRKASHRPLQILVLDGASTDGSVDYLHTLDGDPDVLWRSRPDGGVAQAIAEGLERTSTPLCAVQSSDDLYVSGALDEAVDTLRNYPDVVAVYADAELIDAEGARVGQTNVAPYTLENLLTKRSFVMQSSAVFRTQAARDVGGFRPDRPYVCDSEMWIRMALRAPLLRVPGVWSRYRLHSEQRDRQSDRILREWWELLEALRPLLTRRQRRHARIGAYMTTHRYGDPHGWTRSTALWRALALDPTALAVPGFPRADLVLPLRYLGSRVKRLFRGRARLDLGARDDGSGAIG
ncbi:MAG: glycosyltransferase [Planctomycetes bacterium]|nr:glycosyltransferase [Planctomycetota bacterium]